MRIWMAALAAALTLFASVWAGGAARAAAPDHGAWDLLLGRYVSERPDGINRVDYAAWKTNAPDQAALEAYIKALEGTRPSQLSRDEQFAFWANLYNALTVETILTHYPVASIKNIRSEGVGLSLSALQGPWDTKLVTVEGKRLSLNEIEHGVLRPTYHDVRVHYAVNCASLGCPNLQRQAFHAATLDAQLDAAARAYINHPRGVSVTARGLKLSSIYKWYASDFGDAAGLRAHLARYAAAPLAAELKRAPAIAGYDYDWRLNGTTTR